MDQLEAPEAAVWEERRRWFEESQDRCARAGAPAPSEQACALMIDLQAIFCAGAWSAVVILAAAVVESQLPDPAARRAAGFAPGPAPESAPGPGVDRKTLRWLRGLRNRLVHEDPNNPVLTIGDQWLSRNRWERDARRAVQAAFAALYPETEAP